MPEKVTIGKSGANTAALSVFNDEPNVTIEVRQIKVLNNLLEQDHRAIKRMVRPMLGFKSFRMLEPLCKAMLQWKSACRIF